MQSDDRSAAAQAARSVRIHGPRDLRALLGKPGPLEGYRAGAETEGSVEVRMGSDLVVVTWPSFWRAGGPAFEAVLAAAAGAGSRTGLLVLGEEADFAGLAPRLRDRVAFSIGALPASPDRLAVQLRNVFEGLYLRRRVTEEKRAVGRYKYEIEELLETSRALASERDKHTLLAAILLNARQITGADAGSVYVLEGEAANVRDRSLHFMLSQNDSVAIDFSERTLPVDSGSIVGAAVLTREPINLPDLYALDFDTNPWGFRHDKSFDEKTGYKTRSMLTVPMIDARDGVIGLIQLINKKRDPKARLSSPEAFEHDVVPFDQASQDLACALAAQAGVALENAILYQEQRELFEGFVHASVHAIESRDPTTSGHSRRVADLTVGLAEVVDRMTTGPYADLHFSGDHLTQIRYAALLHDFGKVGVREKVLVKAKKLYDPDRELILARFDFIRKALEAEILARKLEAPKEGWPALEAELAARQAELNGMVELILRANEPTVLPEGGFDALAGVAAHRYRALDGTERPFLLPDEVAALSIARGSLTDVERIEIESHVVHTRSFLKRIPWPRQFTAIPDIAASHHEKLDRSGYPQHLSSVGIPPESKMMTISDIYDALTASDRPYKKALPREKALAILETEVRGGKCDPELFRAFVEAQVWLKLPPPSVVR